MKKKIARQDGAAARRNVGARSSVSDDFSSMSELYTVENTGCVSLVIDTASMNEATVSLAFILEIIANNIPLNSFIVLISTWLWF